MLAAFGCRGCQSLCEVGVLASCNRVSCCRCSAGLSVGLRARSVAAFPELCGQLVHFGADLEANLQPVGNVKSQLAVHGAFGASVRARAIKAFEKADSIFDYGPSSKQATRHS